jgi:hypothetical protein
MILWRKIEDKIVKKWDAHFANPRTYTSYKDVPIWAIVTFLPDPNDKDCGVSTYAAADKSDLEIVAAAMNLKMDGDTYNFIGVPLTRLKKVKFLVNQTPGETRLTQVDQAHHDIRIETALQAARLAHVYLSGTSEKIQKSMVKAASQSAARSELVDFRALANDGNARGNARLAGFIASDHVLVMGNPA